MRRCTKGFLLGLDNGSIHFLQRKKKKTSFYCSFPSGGVCKVATIKRQPPLHFGAPARVVFFFSFFCRSCARFKGELLLKKGLDCSLVWLIPPPLQVPDQSRNPPLTCPRAIRGLPATERTLADRRNGRVSASNSDTGVPKWKLGASVR